MGRSFSLLLLWRRFGLVGKGCWRWDWVRPSPSGWSEEVRRASTEARRPRLINGSSSARCALDFVAAAAGGCGLRLAVLVLRSGEMVVSNWLADLEKPAAAADEAFGAASLSKPLGSKLSGRKEPSW